MKPPKKDYKNKYYYDKLRYSGETVEEARVRLDRKRSKKIDIIR